MVAYENKCKNQVEVPNLLNQRHPQLPKIHKVLYLKFIREIEDFEENQAQEHRKLLVKIM